MSYNRYAKLMRDGKICKMPPITLNKNATDAFETYSKDNSSLGNISYKHYDDPNYDWLILLANKEIADLEYQIPDNTLLRIPYPLDVAIQDYESKIDQYDILYGLD